MKHTTMMVVAAMLVACGGDTGAEQPDLAADGGAGGTAGSGSGGSSSTADSSSASTSSVSSGTGGGGVGGGDGGSGGATPVGLDCTGSTAVLCDDFESGDIDAALWSTVEANGGSVAVSDTVVREGQYALRVTLPSADGARGFLRANDSIFPLANNEMFGRVFIYVSPDVPQTHSKMLMLRGALPNESGQYRLDINGGTFNSRYSTPNINDNVQHGGLRKMGVDAVPEQWVCVEWQYDGTNHEMRYWFDGVLNDDMTVLSSESPQWTAPAFDRFEVGWQTFQAGAQPSYDIYFDALVLDSARIGCGS